MQTYYSILMIPLRSEINEQISIGLLLRDEGTVFFKYSVNKLNWLKSQLSSESFRMIVHSLKAIDTLLRKEASVQNEYTYTLFAENTRKNPMWDRNYIFYLSQYNHNLLTFTPPENISLDASQYSFERLYRLFVSDDQVITPALNSESSIDEYLQHNFYPKIKQRVNQQVKLTQKDIPSLFLPTQVDFIGRNEEPVVGQKIQFSKRQDYLGNDLREIYTLAKAFEEIDIKNGKYYIIGKEPEIKDYPKSHEIWKSIIKSKTVDYVEYRDIEKIADYLEKHDVKPFLEEKPEE
ncbi:MAG: hypothetical protein SF052_11680 [Bacteroidia bacterium]|nr:hypothetical protein [Bacteroidia bacterium]